MPYTLAPTPDVAVGGIPPQGRRVTPCCVWFRVSGFGFRVSGSEFGFEGLGFWVSGFGIQVSGFGFRVSGFRFMVYGSWFMAWALRARRRGQGIMSMSFVLTQGVFKVVLQKSTAPQICQLILHCYLYKEQVDGS